MVPAPVSARVRAMDGASPGNASARSSQVLLRSGSRAPTRTTRGRRPAGRPVGVADRQQPAQGRPQVVVLSLDPVEPDRLPRTAELSQRLLGQRQEPVGVPVPCRLRLASLLQRFQRKPPDRLQQVEPRLARLSLDRPHQVLIDKRPNEVDQGRGGADGAGAQDSTQFLRPQCPLRPLDREAAREDGEASEEGLGVGGEEVVDQAMVARRVCWRGGRSRGPAVSRSRARSRRSRIASGVRTLTRAAASSSARGRPSRRRQISATAGAFALGQPKAGPDRAGPIDEEVTAGDVASVAGPRARRPAAAAKVGPRSLVRSGGGAASGSLPGCADSRRRRADRPGLARRQRPARGCRGGGAGPDRVGVRRSRQRTVAAALPRPRDRAIAAGTATGSSMAASETRAAPSTNPLSRAAPAAMARRVLPTPPGPVRVTRRESGSRTSSQAPRIRRLGRSGAAVRHRSA